MWHCLTCGKTVALPAERCPSNKHQTQLPSNVIRAADDQIALEVRYQACCKAKS